MDHWHRVSLCGSLPHRQAVQNTDGCEEQSIHDNAGHHRCAYSLNKREAGEVGGISAWYLPFDCILPSIRLLGTN